MTATSMPSDTSTKGKPMSVNGTITNASSRLPAVDLLPGIGDDPERGDVPRWVLITLMTAGLVVLIWAVAGPALTALFEQAIAKVGGL